MSYSKPTRVADILGSPGHWRSGCGGARAEVGEGSLLCLACSKLLVIDCLTTYHDTPIFSDEEGWGEMMCAACEKKLRYVTPGYEGSKAETPLEYKEP